MSKSPTGRVSFIDGVSIGRKITNSSILCGTPDSLSLRWLMLREAIFLGRSVRIEIELSPWCGVEKGHAESIDLSLSSWLRRQCTESQSWCDGQHRTPVFLRVLLRTWVPGC